MNSVRCVITDIEMPIMDGHRLTKLIKSDDATRNIPVIIFSSLVNEDSEFLQLLMRYQRPGCQSIQTIHQIDNIGKTDYP